MRFRIPGIRPATLSAEEVRAVREACGWTVEQMADTVHASPLEVSAWEAGAVRVPPEQTERIRWFMDMDAWNVAVARALRECAWVGEHAPYVYEKMFNDVSGTWFAENVRVRDHVMGCPTCRAMWIRAERMGGPPPEPDVADTWRSRYRRWTKRFPGCIRTPLQLLGQVPELAPIALFVLTVPDEHSGIPARIFGVGMGALMGLLTLRLSELRLSRDMTRRPRAAGVLAGFAASVAGVFWWSFSNASVDLRDPRLWAGSAAVGVAMGLIRARHAKDDAGGGTPAPVSADADADADADAERAALPGARPEVDLGVPASAVRDAQKVK